MAPISRDDLEAAHRGMVTALENVLFDLGEVGRARVKQLADTSQEIFTGLQDRLEETESAEQELAEAVAEAVATNERILVGRRVRAVEEWARETSPGNWRSKP